MEENRQTWNDFLVESFQYPDTLSGVEYSLEKRITKGYRKKGAFYSSISLIAAALLFVILVNSSTAFASGVFNIPVIGKLAEFVKFDKSLSNAIENEYVQEVDLIAWDGEQRLLLPYVIADEKNLVIFYQLPHEYEQESNEWVNITLESMTNRITGEKIEGFSCETASVSIEGREENNGFLQQRYRFAEAKLPTSIEIKVAIEKEIHESSMGVISQDADATGGEVTEITTVPTLKKVGNYTFQIDFEEFAKPIIYELHKSYSIQGQKLILEKLNVYPTGTEVIFSFPDENTAWIKDLDLVVEQEGKIVYKGNSGSGGRYDDQRNLGCVYIESNYFDEPKEQEILIQSIRLMDKEEEYITVDLDNNTITPAIEDMELMEVIKNEGKASLIFSTKVTGNDGFGMFGSEYTDEEGNLYELNEQGMSIMNSLMCTNIIVEIPTSGKVILQRSLTPKIILEEPIRIDFMSKK